MKANERIAKEGASGCLPAPLVGHEVTLGELTVEPDVFQHREELYSLSRSEEHIAELQRRIRNGTGMDPLVIWWSGQRWIVIEGHHRHEAYRRSDEGAGIMVPVKVFSGTLKEAKEKAGEDNNKARLAISKAEANAQAWRLWATGEERSPAKIAARTKVSRQQVYRMKRDYEKLKEGGVDPVKLSWPEARAWAKRNAAEMSVVTDYEERRDAIVERFFAALHNEFGGTWVRQSDAIAYGLAQRNPGFAEMLVGSPHFEPIVDAVMLEHEAAAAEDAAMNGWLDPSSPGYGDY